MITDFTIPPLILSDELLRAPIRKMERVNKLISEKQKGIGTGSEAFQTAKKYLAQSIRRGESLITAIDTKLKVRAFANVLLGESGRYITLNQELLSHLASITPIPGSLLIESIQRYYFNHFTSLKKKGLLQAICDWLLWAFSCWLCYHGYKIR